MNIVFAADHAGYALKEVLVPYVRDELGYTVEDLGAFTLDTEDDYPEIVDRAARAVAADPAGVRAVLLGGSGQGEAIAANRHCGVRAVVYYGPAARRQRDASQTELDLLTSTRAHNDANALSLGARFLTEEEAKAVVRAWLAAEFSGDERHVQRIRALDAHESCTQTDA